MGVVKLPFKRTSFMLDMERDGREVEVDNGDKETTRELQSTKEIWDRWERETWGTDSTVDH